MFDTTLPIIMPCLKALKKQKNKTKKQQQQKTEYSLQHLK